MPTKRRMFLQDVSKKMMQRQLLRRSTTPSISFSMKKFVSTVVPRVQVSSDQAVDEMANTSKPKALQKKPTRCRFCPRSLGRRSIITCSLCSLHVCSVHRSAKQMVFCLDCSEKKSK
ncbi:hypothetical protein RvY_19672-1 [Ramazzottius varieornatus]|uniref:Uncharacterized protein n=1 Tax=Ramazzottius varieornatus TaxID=947166 RepID=A0A1D1VDS2_RAMVA|nr:hypothetical protein RvY_10737-2 [Ramazzottius varieornatus]GAV06248.1 hypothetical protein RvY_16268-2 [Ramazzottius varieornatus]GAV09932.1 hypothetical protein RvY_19402-1 [Ramazzottius varieornatus]GAV10096.1 hypothetical protein RvY_19672-1 [Ramazzottius varieornatus]